MKPGWTTVAVGDIAEVVMGQAPVGSTYNTRGEGVGLIAGAGDFHNSRLVPSKFTTAPGKLSQAGDIVLSIRASIGAKVLADGVYCLGRGVAGIRATERVATRFLWHSLTWLENALKAKGRGATFLQVNRKDIAELQLPLPPLNEQRRIVAALDRATVVIGGIGDLRRRTRSIGESVVQQSSTGAGRWSTIGESLTLRSGSTLPATRRRPGGVPVYGANGAIGEHDEATHEQPHVTIGRVGAVGAVNVTAGRAWISENALIVVKAPEHLSNGYLAIALAMADLGRFASQSAQPLITQRKVADVPLWIPSQAEALRIDAILDRLAEVERANVERVARADALFASLQSRAFRGEL